MTVRRVECGEHRRAVDADGALLHQRHPFLGVLLPAAGGRGVARPRNL
ncbi:hypothetical protein [Nocardia sp. NPDC050710]